ncbi:MAG: peptidase M22 [Oscillospiraceae bacterium]|nr:peptidase M22 [Oscillospiraceae bacterium]
MAVYLGLDTSNYTTSAALYDTAQDAVMQAKQLLPVRPGEKGLRQSDAVFHHTVQLPGVLSRLTLPEHLAGIGVSVRPRNAEGSYMPCFLCGEGAADMLGQALHVPVYRTSHQIGHILAALYSAKAESLLHAPFLAFHVSGGTTDCVLCEPDAETLLRITPVGTSLDLKAGQAVDRVGVMLGLSFPCGQALEALAVKSTRRFTYRPTMKGCDCCLSGLENQCRRQLEDGMPPEDIAAFCLTAIGQVLREMTLRAREACGALPVLYAGGVMADVFLRSRLELSQVYFAEPAFSCDNAAGTALYAALCGEGERLWQS